MKIAWRFSLFAHEQPTPEVWDRVLAITDGTGLDTGVPVMRLGTVATEAERDELAGRLQEAGAVLTVGPETVYDAADIAAGEYVGVFPAEVRLEVTEPGVVVTTGPCPECGLVDEFDVDQPAPFTIADDAADGDLSALPGGGLAVSARVVGVLQDLGATGWSTRPLLVAGQPSRRWLQVVADRVALVPCEHTDVVGEPFCRRCGRARGEVAGWLWWDPAVLGGDDVVARHPGGRAMLYLSRRVREALTAAGVHDLVTSDVLRPCPRHA